MSFKKNIIANYVSQIYVGVTGIIILPLYLKFMGAEAYGLVGFFTTLQAWFGILDLGLTPTIARETARLHGQAITLLHYRYLLRALQLIFIIVGFLGSGIIIFFANSIAHSWLKIQLLPIPMVTQALQLMAVSIGLRWISSLYRAVLTGSEQFIWLSYYNTIFTTLRYPGVIPILIYVGSEPFVFFSYQILISTLELISIAYKAMTGLPKLAINEHLTHSFANLVRSVKSILHFSLTITATTSIWILITQTDKLVLSKLLPLTEYGYFTLAVLAASSILMFSGPISNALLPRLVKLHAENNEKNFLLLYRQATRLVAIIIVPVTLTLSFFPEQILWIWTGNVTVAESAAPILRLYALGNGALSLTAFPYYLQYAYGNMRLHLIGNIFFVCILIPSIILSTLYYGMVGAGWVWLVANIFFFVIWTAIVHTYYFKNLHEHWLFEDVLPIIVITTGTFMSLKPYLLITNEKYYTALQIILFTIITFALNVIYMNFIPIMLRLKERAKLTFF